MAHREDEGVGYVHGDGEYGHTPPGAGHEHTDTNVWIIVKFGLWLAIAAIIVHVGMGLIFGLMVQQREQVDHQFPLAVGQERRLPAAPRLQQFPVNERYEFQQQETAALESYRWVNRETGQVQVPIEEAKRLVLQRGLPSRAPEPVVEPTLTPAPGMVPSDASSGRTMERR